MKENWKRPETTRRALLATTMLVSLPLSLAIDVPNAFAQTAPSNGNGAIELPTVEVTANQQSTGCGPYGGAPCSGFGGAGLAQDPYNTSYVLPEASTGTKTDTPVMDTPLNVQSVSQQVLVDQQAITLGQALQNVSGVSVTNGTFTNTGYNSSGVLVRGFLEQTYYRDGFRVDSTYTGNGLSVNSTQLANVANVEVLKGPGAVLYGLVEPGGIINIVTKEPLDVPYYDLQQQIGSLADYRTTIDATGPLTDDKSVLYRMNMSYENNGAPFGSFIDLTHSQDLFLAPVVKWNIDGSTWVKVEAQYDDYRSDSYYAFDPIFNGAVVNVPRSTNYGGTSPEVQTDLFAALTWLHDFNNAWSIKQQIAYDFTSIYNNANVPSLPITLALLPQLAPIQIQEPQTTISTNVDITGHFNTFGAEHTLLLGGDIYRLTGTYQDSIFFATTPVALFNPVPQGIPSPECPCYPAGLAFTQDTAGLYLQDQIKLPYNFYLMAGARYQYIHQTSLSGNALDDLQPYSPLTAQALTPRFGLLWRPQEWISFYTNYEEGFGPNQGLIYPGGLAPPTSAKSSEAGVKLEFFNGKLRISADYFELVKTNVPVANPNPILAAEGFEALVGEARSKGPELDIQGEILPGWSVIVNYTNDDVRVTEATPGSIPAVGQRLFLVPRNQANFWTTYEFQDETFKGVKIGAGYHYVGSRPIDDEFEPNGTYPLLPAYGTVDLMAAYSFKAYGANLTAQLNITNLLDTTFYPNEITSGPLTPGFSGVYRAYGPPFAAVGSLRAQF